MLGQQLIFLNTRAALLPVNFNLYSTIVILIIDLTPLGLTDNLNLETPNVSTL